MSLTFLISCNQTGENRTYSATTPISDYTKGTENFEIKSGYVHFDLLPKNLTTHRLDTGTDRVFVYERTGVTMIDANDWEAKYTETLIFQIDSSIDK